jgi:hypothetical protein
MGKQKLYKSQAQLLREGAVWGDSERPPKDCCALCGKKLARDRVVEMRATGKSGTLQSWSYCRPCAPVKPVGRRIG